MLSQCALQPIDKMHVSYFGIQFELSSANAPKFGIRTILYDQILDC